MPKTLRSLRSAAYILHAHDPHAALLGAVAAHVASVAIAAVLAVFPGGVILAGCGGDDDKGAKTQCDEDLTACAGECVDVFNARRSLWMALMAHAPL